MKSVTQLNTYFNINLYYIQYINLNSDKCIDIIGPLLFIIHSNDLLKLYLCAKTPKTISFDDNKVILVSYKTIANLYHSDNYGLKIVNNWYDNNF